MSEGIRCPHCAKRLGDWVVGTYQTRCPRCKATVVVHQPEGTIPAAVLDRLLQKV